MFYYRRSHPGSDYSSSLARLGLFTYLFISVNHLGLAMVDIKVLPNFPKLSYHGEIDENPRGDVLNKVTVELPPKKSPLNAFTDLFKSPHTTTYR